jgi:hypothetical protein
MLYTAELIKCAATAKKLTKSYGSLGGCVRGAGELRDRAGCAARISDGNTASRSEMERQTLPLDDPRQRGPDMSRARLSASVALRDGLESVVEYSADQADIAPSLRRRSHSRAWRRSRPAQSHCTAGGSRPCA